MQNVVCLLNVSPYIPHLLVLVCRLAFGFQYKIEAYSNEWQGKNLPHVKCQMLFEIYLYLFYKFDKETESEYSCEAITQEKTGANGCLLLLFFVE